VPVNFLHGVPLLARCVDLEHIQQVRDHHRVPHVKWGLLKHYRKQPVAIPVWRENTRPRLVKVAVHCALWDIRQMILPRHAIHVPRAK